MVAVSMEVLTCVGGFPVHRGYQYVVRSQGIQGVQERDGSITAGNLCGEFDKWVNEINMF